jgi:hypothetical protein
MREANSSSVPQLAFSGRLSARLKQASRADLQDKRLGLMRLVSAVVCGGLAWMAIVTGAISGWWVLLPVSGFAMLVICHDRVHREHRAMTRAIFYYEKGLDRLKGRWIGTGEQGEKYGDPLHPYAADLDLFGRGSLFELLCTARTSFGMDTLADWLKNAADPDLVRQRQLAVEELRPNLQLREDLAILGTDVGSAVDSDAISAWGARPTFKRGIAIRIVSATLGGAVVIAAIPFIFSNTRIWLGMVLMMEGILALALRTRTRQILRTAEKALKDLELIFQVVKRLEAESFKSSLLNDLRRRLGAGPDAASVQISRLKRLIVLLDSRRNPIFAPLAAVLLWGTQLAMAVESWRHRHGSLLNGWLQAIGEIEALSCLAGYAYEHPEDPFPEFIQQPVEFHALNLAHPLLPDERAVRNSIRLDQDQRVLIVSGSNMSGKSTLLRTVGINAVLAFAGAPVRASRLRISPLGITASIRISDSLQEGSSRFYTEIRKISQAVKMASGKTPVLFLLDELLQGTNSHDRRIGAEAVIRALVNKRAIGMVTTHDLALAEIEPGLDGVLANFHFEDQIENGKIAFDYLLRPGVVTKSNALELMRSVGLEV